MLAATATCGYRLTSPFSGLPLGLLLQPYCAHSCSHFLNRSGCSEWAELHVSPCSKATAGPLLAGAWQAGENSDRYPQASIQPWTSIGSTEGRWLLGFCHILGFYGAESSLATERWAGDKLTRPVKIFWWPCQHKQAGALPPPSHPRAAWVAVPATGGYWLPHGWLWPHGWPCWHGQPGRRSRRVGSMGRGSGRGRPAKKSIKMQPNVLLIPRLF